MCADIKKRRRGICCEFLPYCFNVQTKMWFCGYFRCGDIAIIKSHNCFSLKK